MQILWRFPRAKVLAQKGELEAAERLAREAVELAERTDFLNLHADALVGLAEVLRLAGRATDSSATAEAAIKLYKRKGNLVSAARVRAAVDAASPAPA